ncbi:MAG: hypothetical protein RJA07_2678 [Bacteroidota bacterium]|jgi:hypothetical protein
MQHSFERILALAIILFFTIISISGFLYWIIKDALNP